MFTTVYQNNADTEIKPLFIYLFIFNSYRYKAVYNYNPQNRDELELKEGDIVQVIEKCDDGWFVGNGPLRKLSTPVKWISTLRYQE